MGERTDRRGARSRVPLNEGWLYRPEFEEAYLAPDADEAGFEPVRLPHTNRELPFSGFEQTDFAFTSCYRLHFHAVATEGVRTRLHFEAVMAAATVYCNGTLAGEHLGGYTPFDIDVTDLLAADGDNVLAGVVDSTERPDVPPFGHVIDYLTYGGIYREVQLETVPELHIADLWVHSAPAASGRRVGVEVTLAGLTPGTGAPDVRVTLRTGDDEPVVHDFHPDGTGPTFATAFDADLRLWDPDSPVLYTVTAALHRDGTPHDETSVRTGFRDAEFVPGGLRINGRTIKVRGLNRHQSYPYVGYAMPKRAQRADADILANELGVNLVRTSHYPQSRHFLDRCDELGLLVFEEIPGWQHIGDAAWQRNSLADVEAMIRRDRSRPSIVLWGVRINESADEDAFYTATNALAHSLDPTRQTGGVRNFAESSLLEDVYTYNDFVHRGANAALKPAGKVTKAGAPYLVTEHNGHMFPTKKFDNEERRTEHALRHLRVLDAAYGDPANSGAIGWCLADYNTHAEFGSGDLVCYHGVLDAFRLPKLAASAYTSQADGEPVLVVSSQMQPGEQDAAEIGTVHVFTNCDAVRLSRGGQVIGTHLPDRRGFPHLPHPPVAISDLIGDLIQLEQGYPAGDAARIKRVLAAVVRYGDKSLPLRYQLLMATVMVRRRLSYEDAVALYNRYVSGWGSVSREYTFEGLVGGEVVCSVVHGPSSSDRLDVVAETTELVEEETYDVCRVVVSHLDRLGRVMPYSAEAVRVQVAGAAELIGPATLPLTGGSAGFWIRSAGAGPIRVTVASDRLGEQTLQLSSRVLDESAGVPRPDAEG
jgi:beta-galactosidase